MLLLVLTLLVVAAAPWCYPGVTQPFPGPVLVAGGVVAILASLKLSSPRPALPFLVLLVWYGLSQRSSLDPYRSMLACASQAAATGVAVALLLTVTSRQRWRAAAHVLVAAASLLVVTHLDQERLRATFSNADSFAPIPLLGALLALGLMPRARKPELFYLLSQCALLMGGTALTGSRAALLALALGVLVFLVRRGPVFTLAPLGLAIAAMLLTGTLDQATGRIQDLGQGKDSQGLLMRQDVLEHGLAAALRYSLLGSGPGTFALAYQEFRPVRPEAELPAYMYVNVAHDDWVEVAVETGWIGLILWLGLQLLAGRAALAAGSMRHEASAVLSFLAAMAAFSALNFVLAVPALKLWWFAVLALAFCLPHERQELNRFVVPPVLLLAGVLTVLFGVRVEEANRFLAQASRAESELRFEDAVKHLDRAVAVLPERPRSYARRARVKMALGQFQSVDPAPDIQQAFGRSPRDPECIRLKTDFLKLAGDLPQAERVLQSAHRVMPYQDWVLKDLLQVQILQRKLPEACDTLRELSGARPAYLDQLAELLRIQPEVGARQLDRWKDWAEVDRLAEKAGFYAWLQQRHPDNLRYLFELGRYDRILASQNDRDPYYEKALIATNDRKALERFVQKYPERADAALALDSRPALERALASNGSDPRLLARMGTLLQEEGNPELAADYFQRALELDPQNREAKAGVARNSP